MNATSFRTNLIAPAIYLIAVALCGGVVLSYKACSRALAIAEKFQSGKITQTFYSEIQRVSSTHGDRLELATFESNEYFHQEDERRWGVFYFGTTTADIAAPCTFRYHLQLSDRWTLSVSSNMCIVKAPNFQASLPVAIHTDRMFKRAESGWLRWDKHDMLNDLERTMTPVLDKSAEDKKHRAAVREDARESVGKFVKNWLMREDHWRKDRFTAIIVEFPDDPKSDNNPSFTDQAPVIRLTD